MSSDHQFEAFTFDGQQDTTNFGLDTSAPFPLALRPANGWNPTLEDSIQAIRRLSESGKIFEDVRIHGGAVLIRGLPIRTPQDYSEVAHAFGFLPHEEVGRPPLRTVLAPNVKTANEGPPELPIWPHSEYGWSTINPSWLTFSCLDLPDSGGETPVISSLGLAAALKQRAPEFVEKLLQKGVKYVYRYGLEDVKSNTGTSVIGAYGQHVKPGDDKETTRRKIEEEVRRHSNRFQWHEDGSLSVTHIVPIIRIHNDTGLTTWFGNLTSAWGRSTYHGATEFPYRGDDGSYHPPPEYGDGTPIEKEYLDLALALAESLQVLVKWELGDIVLLDNYAVMHSRSPWTGKRTVLAALWNDPHPRISDYPPSTRSVLDASPEARL
ncbi:Clavaminate synthase-like protein [Durotheca rogersii]|uniref:Clavaminate synthase-like protein n=1 Tax=Durotheca rogersii TaxID=419775 RepID=UPI0022211CDA|nr:Clavaminate synthase-like protein [Durotheca rogersii]KAI5862032.1 Clavaminate synthase-like protein [Durotheca rogersii]